MTTFADESTRQRALASALREAAADAEHTARRFEVGDAGEAAVRAALVELGAEGWHQLHKRRWPGTRRADLDHVLIGPGGVVVLDTKNWKGQLSGVRGRLWRGQAEETEAVRGMAGQVAAVAEVLSRTGLPPAAVTGALVFVQQPLAVLSLGGVYAMGSEHVLRWLRALGSRLTHDRVTELAGLLEVQLPPAVPEQRLLNLLPRRQPAPRGDVEQVELFDVRSVDLTELERAAALGTEEWMSYLHPSQRDVVMRRYGGPSRIRGPAGCGKTVVALHRAAYLAGQYEGEGLFTSYVRTLPTVLGSLYARLSPGTAPRFTFQGVHSLAAGILRESGDHFRLDPPRAAQCYRQAWQQVGAELHADSTMTAEYWREEVSCVIKGRGLLEFGQYADLARTGRRTALHAGQRRAVWDLYVEYQRLLERVRVLDFDDVIDRALTLVEDGQAKQYRFVFVDEAQDLTMQGLRLMAALVTDDRDGLTLVGDGQQAVYPGGCTLKEAGISVTGRSIVLDTNYRNASEVLDVAARIVAQDQFDDLEDVAENGLRVMKAARPGGRVLQVTARNHSEADILLADRLVQDLATGFPPGDGAVLCRSRGEVARIRRLLASRGLPTVDLEDYDGTPGRALKIGTTKRAKGLEFVRVYLPNVAAYLVLGAQEPERVERERRELFVAMTRARDGLWVCRVA